MMQLLLALVGALATFILTQPSEGTAPGKRPLDTKAEAWCGGKSTLIWGVRSSLEH